MEKNLKKLTDEIIARVLELAELAGGEIIPELKWAQGTKDVLRVIRGATGGLRVLVDEGYFDNPRQLSEIIEKLKQEGRHYPSATISMGLLNLVKERVLMRFRDKGDKKWKYVTRK
ncbi:MAG: hypothetical protein D4Q79_01170 [Spirochaetia bacterium]|nr:MAG: hypothetical protein D4Q79_01170 [Spirochaetia bacterium]